MLLDQVVLVIASCALLAGASRLAWLIVAPDPRGSGPGVSIAECVIAAAVLAAGFIVCWTLALGLAGIAGSVPALAAGPVALWLATRFPVPTPTRGIGTVLAGRWEEADCVERAVALALLGLAAGCAIEVALQPGFDVDAVSEHLADAVGWLHSGHAGAVQTFSYDFPIGYFPVTNEVLLTWILGISRSFAPLAVWSPALAALTLLSLWRLLDVLRIPRAAAWAAVAAVATLPTFAVGINAGGPGTDLPAVAWLACSAALSAGSARRPALLGLALLAAGLGVGTKTTIAPLAAAALVAGAWQARAALLANRRWLALGAVGALVVGVPWYVRDTLSHGWPLWPFTTVSGADPVPHAISLFNGTFLSRPGATLSATPSLYLKWVGGGVALIAGVFTIPWLVRSRAALGCAAVAVLALLAWAAAPFTGISSTPLLEPLALSAVRYMLAALGACAVALSVCARDPRLTVRRLVTGLLGAAAAGSLVADLALGYPAVPRLQYLVAGAGVGAVLGAAWTRTWAPLGARSASAAVAVAAVVLLRLAAPGWLTREVKSATSYAPAVAFMLSQPGFASGDQPVASAPQVLATLAGPRLRHPISLIPAGEPCGQVRARLRRGWVVIWPGAFVAGITTPFDAPACLRTVRPVFDDGTTLIYKAAS